MLVSILLNTCSTYRMCFRPIKVSEYLKISHEAEEMASHAAGRKYNVTSGRMEGGDTHVAIHGNWQVKCAVPKVCASKSLSTGKCQMKSKVSRQFSNWWKDPFFLSIKCVLERTAYWINVEVSPSRSTSGHGIHMTLMQIIRRLYSNLRTLCITYTYIHMKWCFNKL